MKPEYNSIAPWVEVVRFHQVGFDSCNHTGSPSIRLEYKQDQPIFIALVLFVVVVIWNTVLTNSNKSETAVHCYDPVLSVLVMLVTRDVFHVVSALQLIFFG